MKTNSSLPESYIECFEKLQIASEQNSVDYMLVGAIARDLVFEYNLGIKSQRLTYDIDIGLSVNNWESFNQFKSSLIALGFDANSKRQQRLSFQPENTKSELDRVQLDVVPHGGINNTNNQID